MSVHHNGKEFHQQLNGATRTRTNHLTASYNEVQHLVTSPTNLLPRDKHRNWQPRTAENWQLHTKWTKKRDSPSYKIPGAQDLERGRLTAENCLSNPPWPPPMNTSLILLSPCLQIIILGWSFLCSFLFLTMGWVVPLSKQLKPENSTNRHWGSKKSCKYCWLAGKDILCGNYCPN